MGHARGAAAVRLAKMEPEPEVAIAQVRQEDDCQRVCKQNDTACYGTKETQTSFLCNEHKSNFSEP